jgi:hypothetical protein
MAIGIVAAVKILILVQASQSSIAGSISDGDTGQPLVDAGRRFWAKAGSRIAGEATLDSLGRYVIPLSQKNSSAAP